MENKPTVGDHVRVTGEGGKRYLATIVTVGNKIEVEFSGPAPMLKDGHKKKKRVFKSEDFVEHGKSNIQWNLKSEATRSSKAKGAKG